MATTSLGRLTLDLVARISEFTGPLDQAERRSRNSTKKIAESFDLASASVKLLGAAAAGLSAVSITEFANRMIQAGNEVERFAKLSNASVQQFQYYAKGAETAGVSMEKFADQLKDMQDRIGDFQQTGGGPMADFFRNIAPLVGVSIQQFQKLSGPDALQLFYDSLKKAGASGNDIKFYMEQIISDSSLLIPLLEDGGAGFKKWGEAAKQSGAIMSSEMVASLKEAKENLQYLDLKWQGIENTLVNTVVPAVRAVADNMDTIKEVAAAVGAAIAARLAISIALGTAQLAQMSIFAIRAGVGLVQFASAAGVATGAAGLLRGALAFLGGPVGLGMLAVQAAAAGAAFLYVKRTSEETTPSLDGKTQSIREMTEAYLQMTVAQRKAALFDETKRLNELQQQYRDTAQQVAVYAAGLGNLSTVSDKSKAAIADWVQQFNQGKISAKELADRVAGLSDVSGEYVSYLVKYTAETDKAKSALDVQKNVLTSLSAATDDMTAKQQAQTVAVNANAAAWMSLSEKQREALRGLQADTQRQAYIELNMKSGFSREKAEAYADYRQSAGLGFTGKALTPQEMATINASFNRKNYTFGPKELAAVARAKGIAAQNNFAEIEQLYGLKPGTLAALMLQESRARSDAVSPTGAIGLFQTTSIFRKTYGLNRGSSARDTAIAAARDLANSYKVFGNWEQAFQAYNAGIGGVRDYMKGGLSAGKRKEVAGYAPGVAKWLAAVNGTSKVDSAVTAPTQEQLLKDQNDVAAAQQAIVDKRKEIDAKYYTQSQQAEHDHQEAVKQVKEAYAGTPELATRLAAEDKLYAARQKKIKADQAAEYQQYFAFETDRITQIRQNYAHEKSLVDSNTELTEKQKTEARAALDRQMRQEIAAFRLSVDEKMAASRDFYSNEVQIAIAAAIRKKRAVELDTDLTKAQKQEQTRFIEDQLKQQLDAIALNNDKMLLDSQQYFMSETDYMQQRYEQERREIEQTARAKNQAPELTAAQLAASRERQKREESQRRDAAYQTMRGAVIAEDPVAQMQDQYSSELAQQGDLLNKKLIAYEQYQQAYAAITEKYAKQEYLTRMDLYNNMLGQASGVWGSMTDMVKKAAGEQSLAYKAMFVVQQAMAMAQAAINTEEAATKALTLGPIFGIPAATAIRAMGYASVGLIAAQTLAGFSDGGYTGHGGKYQPAGIVHAGEVVWSQDDIKRWGGVGVVESMRLGRGYADGGVVGIKTPALPSLPDKSTNNVTVNVTVNSDGSAQVTQQGANVLGEQFKNAVLAIIRQEKRQGGALA